MAKGNRTGKGGFAEHPENRNTKGRPKAFDALRELAQRIAEEESKGKNPLPHVEKILRDWASSRDFMKQKGFLEIAYGKVPDAVDFGGAVEIQVKYIKRSLRGTDGDAQRPAANS